MTPSPFLIAGRWRKSEKSADILSPYTGKAVGAVWQASENDIDDAIAAAVAAFGLTKNLPSYARSHILASIATQIGERREDFARLITSDTGKPVSFARTEIERAMFTFATASEEAKRIGGEYLPLDLAEDSTDRFGITRRFPLGPVSAITPFNFPLNLVAHKIAPAIAAGNSIVLKPSSSGARVSLLLGELICQTGLPDGALNIATCTGADSRQLITDKRLKLVSFTGSPAVGWGIKAAAGKKRVVLELGGNAGVIVDRDVDVVSVVAKIARGAFGNAGQSCIAVQRIFVHESIMSTFLERFVQVAEGLVVGDPADDRTIVGPMITEEAARNVETWVREAVGGGAKLLTGGTRKGNVMGPTVLTGTTPEMSVCAEEVFAPVVTVEQFSDLQDALGMINNSRFGLQAGIFTNNLTGALRAFSDLETGGVVLNDIPTYRIDHMPYGGMKESGFGREGIRYAIEEMTELKLLVVNQGS